MKTQDYYRQQSVLTNPGRQIRLYEGLPYDMASIVKIVQNVLIPPYTELLREGYHIELEEIDNTRFGIRRMEDMLERIENRSNMPLTVERPPALRIGAICRNFAVLLVSILRHQGVPARARVGFGSYFAEPYAVDHRLAEFWQEEQGRWVRVDPMIDEVIRHRNNVAFNTLDIGPDDPFMQAGEVWQRCRTGERDPQDFGDSPTDRGMPPIRYALLQDFAYLNRCEMLGSDDWGDLITKPEADLTPDDLELLDRIATLTLNVDTHLDELQTHFAETAYGRAVQAAMPAR
ncbi:transglutaminase-like domain-containing protein [Ktedonospora formicarum]|uniref:Transglutaminase-like domain-containing protein n=1 Tax=Ktedonospora formicarum TaxID=2778364 RepID=A0A8J3I0R0_9CHLR|nr:transglutaminase-like domain-containing protein [Ktedonospora formicarum]GHO47852.1 hypothetical protein KSX_60150 [Ktedonospora formicarum]